MKMASKTTTRFFGFTNETGDIRLLYKAKAVQKNAVSKKISTGTPTLFTT